MKTKIIEIFKKIKAIPEYPNMLVEEEKMFPLLYEFWLLWKNDKEKFQKEFVKNKKIDGSSIDKRMLKICLGGESPSHKRWLEYKEKRSQEKNELPVM
jgi:hypothetical protein